MLDSHLQKDEISFRALSHPERLLRLIEGLVYRFDWERARGRLDGRSIEEDVWNQRTESRPVLPGDLS